MALPVVSDPSRLSHDARAASRHGAPTAPASTLHSPQGDVEDVVAKLRAALESDPHGFANDENTRAILERLNDEVARLYEEEGGAEAEEAEDAAHAHAEQSMAASSAHGATRRSSSASAMRGPTVQLPKGPTPYELWRAAHEVDRSTREVRVWSGVAGQGSSNAWGGWGWLRRGHRCA